MLFESLDKIKRNSIMSSILLVALGSIILLCPEAYIGLLTLVFGYTISHKDKIIEEGYNAMEICKTITENFVYQVLEVGTFHADPHQGNIMVSSGKPYWID